MSDFDVIPGCAHTLVFLRGKDIQQVPCDKFATMAKPRTEDELSKLVSISGIEPPRIEPIRLDPYRRRKESNNNVQFEFCRLCNIEFTSEESHSSSRQHEARAKEISARVTTIIQIRDDARLLPSLIKHSLSPYGPWQGKIYELIGRAFMEEEPKLVQDANSLLLKYKHLEHISLLELAVWKFTCVTVNPFGDDTKGPRTYLEWKQWDANGWKAYKKQQFRCNQVVILVNAIVPFLFDEEIRSDSLKAKDNTKSRIRNSDQVLEPLVSVEFTGKYCCHGDVRSRVRTILEVRDNAEFILSRMEQSLSCHGPFQPKIYELIVRAILEEDVSLTVKTRKRHLPWYESLERISLLELAVWKFVCESCDTAAKSEKSRGWSYLEWKRWLATGWKDHKKTHYRSNRLVSIMKHVVPFLKDETMDGSS